MADVLIVEDTDLQAQLIGMYVRETHDVVGRATTAEQAVRLTESKQPDAVIMDLNLEHGDGVEATERIKNARPDLPVLVSTVHIGADVKERVRDANADAYLQKPYDKAEVLERLDRLCCEFCYPMYDYYD